MLGKLAQWAVPGAVLMAGAWFAAAIVAWVVPGSAGPGEPGETRFYLMQGLPVLGAIGLFAALAGLYLNQASASGRLGRVAFWSTFVGTALVMVALVVGVITVATLGEAVLLVGLFFLAGVVGWLLIIFIPAIAVLLRLFESFGVGAATVAMMWLAIGYALWAHGRAVAGVDVEEAGVQAAGGE